MANIKKTTEAPKESKFKKIAQDATVLCPLMSGREKMTTRDVTKEDELTIIAFGFAPKFDDDGQPIVNADNGEVDTYAVLVFAEHPDMYYTAGHVMTKVCKAWMDGFDTAEEASEELEAEGGVRVRFTESKTHRGNNIVVCDFI